MLSFVTEELKECLILQKKVKRKIYEFIVILYRKCYLLHSWFIVPANILFLIKIC
jgi:hypothetical protein